MNLLTKLHDINLWLYYKVDSLFNKNNKCEAKDCGRRLEKKYKYCSLECAAYCGQFNARGENETNGD